jgi:hypothetical protein
MKFVLLIPLLFFAYFSSAQTPQINRCGTHEALLHQNSLSPGYLTAVNEAFQRSKNNLSSDRATTYTIPVVVHVIYNTPEENIPDSVILNQLQVLNEAYSYSNADTINIRDTFNTIVGTTNIQFTLATVDPNGNSTNGITRTATSVAQFGDFGILTGDMSGLERIKSTQNGGEDPWDQTRYLNIWVADMSVDFLGQTVTALMGYATPPANLPNWPTGSTGGMSDGVVIQFQAFGSNNPNPLDDGNGGTYDFRGRTCVHEVGHYLGLRHIWGDGDCSAEDGIDDTPNADANSQSITNCDTNLNTCIDNIGILGDLPNMQENYMDYSPESCQVAFTLGQRDLMRGVIENYRWDLISPSTVGTIINKSININIYPNPTRGAINISGLNGYEFIKIYTLHGKLIQDITVTSSQVDIKNLPEGLYFVQIENEFEIITKKLQVIK